MRPQPACRFPPCRSVSMLIRSASRLPLIPVLVIVRLRRCLLTGIAWTRPSPAARKPVRANPSSVEPVHSRRRYRLPSAARSDACFCGNRQSALRDQFHGALNRNPDLALRADRSSCSGRAAGLRGHADRPGPGCRRRPAGAASGKVCVSCCSSCCTAAGFDSMFFNLPAAAAALAFHLFGGPSRFSSPLLMTLPMPKQKTKKTPTEMKRPIRKTMIPCTLTSVTS